MSVSSNSSEAQQSLTPHVLSALLKELRQLDSSPPEGVRVIVNEENLSDIQADLTGPGTFSGTPYEGGRFRMRLVLGDDFPRVPPKGYFITRIFHPNISKAGEICVNTLKRDWNPSLGLRHVLMVIRCLLIEPFPESALNEEAGKLLMEDYEGYSRHARLMTSIHARDPNITSSSSDNNSSSMPLTVNSANIVNNSVSSSVDPKAQAQKTSIVRKKSLRRL
eukprot:jgi/Chlat1/3212/Chrsp22S03419